MEKYSIRDQNIGKKGSPENIGKNRKNRSTGQPDLMYVFIFLVSGN